MDGVNDNSNESLVDHSEAGTFDENNNTNKYQVVYFDFETTGFGPNCHILQLAMKSQDSRFNIYINPSGVIDPRASKVHGITRQGRDLFLHGNKIQSYSKQDVSVKTLTYLSAFKNKVVLLAHNSIFDTPLMIKLFRDSSMLEQLENIVVGFTDTLPLLRQKYPTRKGKGAHTLFGLVSEKLKLSTTNAHDASYDVYCLEYLVNYAKISYDDIMNNCKSSKHILQEEEKNNEVKLVLKSLACLKTVISPGMLKKVASTGITFDALRNTFLTQGIDATIILLQQKKKNGKVQLIKTDKILKKILSFLENDLKLVLSLTYNCVICIVKNICY